MGADHRGRGVCDFRDGLVRRLVQCQQRADQGIVGKNPLALFNATMSKERFATIISHIRFDNSARSDDIWTLVMANLEKVYTPHQNLTVDEQLFPYHGRMRFTQYIPSKPVKYGIKVWWLCNAKTHYPLKCEIYAGKLDGADRAQNVGEGVVMSLVQKYYFAGRTMYADNFFS